MLIAGESCRKLTVTGRIIGSRKERDDKMDLMVCVGSSCHLQHSREPIDRLKALIAENGLEGKVELKGSFCMGHCAEEGVCVKFDDQVYSLTLDTVDGFFASKVVARQESR